MGRKLVWILGAVLLTAILATPAAAQMSTYTAPATEKRIISHSPPPSGAQVRTLTPDARPAYVAPAPPPEAPAPDAPAVDPQVGKLLEKVQGMLDQVTPKGQPARSVAQGPVDTRELGHITPGMSQTSVRSRLGGPSSVRQEGTVKRRTASGVTEIIRETWVYDGNASVPPAEVTFEGGYVVTTARAR